jgi:hypothetical protein
MLELFRRDGFVVVPRLLEPAEVEEWTVRLETASGLRRRDFGTPRATGRSIGSWSMSDGVTRRRDFWPLILHDRLLAAARRLVGTGAAFLQDTELHVGFSAHGWHRQTPPAPSEEPCQIVRASLYLQPRETAFRLAVVPGTHLPEPRSAERRRLERAAGWLGRLWSAVERDPLESAALWLRVGSGDCVLVDPRLLRSDAPFEVPTFRVSLSYGLPNGHFHRHLARRRADSSTRPLDPELAGLLRAEGLHAEEPSPNAPRPSGRASWWEVALARGMPPPGARE